MSSLAAARADNFYYPPEFDPVKHKTLAKFTGQHPLRERAKKLDQGILVIRFEVPYNIICTQCNEHIGKGVRFNAEKQQVGAYHSTKIWSFSMRHHCGCRIIIHTDPKNAQYVVKEGARQKEETYSAADAGVAELPTEEEKVALEDPFARLEAGAAKKASIASAALSLAALRDRAEDLHADPYRLNKALRAQLREAKREDAVLDARRVALGLPEHVPLLPESDGDADGAAALFAAASEAKFARNWKGKRRAIAAEPIFPAAQRAQHGGKGAVRSRVDAAGGGNGAAGCSASGGVKQALAGAKRALAGAKRSLAERAQQLAKRQRTAQAGGFRVVGSAPRPPSI